MSDTSDLGRRLRLAMVGGGRDAFIGAVHRMAAALEGGIELCAGALSATPEKALASGRDLLLPPERNYPDWQALVADESTLPPEKRVDLVAIVTPNATHFPIAKACAEAGFHILCDKPMTRTLEEARTLVRVVREQDVIFALTHNYTGYPMVKQARHLVRSGELGRVLKVVVEYPQGWLLGAPEKAGQKQAAWRTDPAQAGCSCCIGDIGSHCENLSHYITGLEMKEICADLTTFVPGRALEDDGNILVRYEGGAKGILYASQVSSGEENNLRIRVYCSEGSLEWRQEEPNDLQVRREGEPPATWRRGNPYNCAAAARATTLPPGHPEGFIDAFANIYRGVARAVRARLAGAEPASPKPDFPTVEDGARGMAFIESAVAAAASDRKWFPLKEWR